jgi:tetratricopeptide (TPR) repeat protein
MLILSLAIGIPLHLAAAPAVEISSNAPAPAGQLSPAAEPAGEPTHFPAAADKTVPTPEPALVDTNVPDTNAPPLVGGVPDDSPEGRLANARYLAKTGQLEKAERKLISLLTNNVPEALQQSALFELEAIVRQKNDLPRAVTINAQFLDRWPNDPRVPEVLLRQGQIYRQMGLNNLALTKFYAVMTAALSLKSDRPDYYPGLVLEAQTEIADTHYLTGRYNEAADYYLRLLKLENPALDRPQVQMRLLRSLTSIGRNEEAVAQARDFLTRFPDAPDQPEVRFYLAQALKQLNQNNEALQQVLLLLREEKAKISEHPDRWAYWQQRAGNEVANQLYREGDYMRALDIYINLAQLDPSPVWQLPVKYQIGLTYERLLQPQKAAENYRDIIKFEPELGTNATPGQKAVIDMARWRAEFLDWQTGAEAANHSLVSSIPPPDPAGTNRPTAVSTP